MVLPLLIAAAGLGAAGKILGGLSANKQAKARAKALQEGARQTLIETGINASMGLEDDDRMLGHAAVVAAAGGGGGLQGSSLDVINDLQRQSLFKAQNTVYQGQTKARSLLMDADSTRSAGRDALMGSLLSAGGTLLGAFGQSQMAKG